MEENLKRPVFGNRHLTNEDQVFKHNAWDNVEWTEEQENEASAIIEKQLEKRLPESEQASLLTNPSSNWNKFYDKHENKFFKDRHWLFTEFPELKCDALIDTDASDDAKKTKSEPMRCFEIGCGVGNTIFPVLKVNQDKNFFMYGCDYSETAVDIVKSHRDYDSKRCHVFVHDITTTDGSLPVPDDSLDLVVMIFVLSALEFHNMSSAIKRIARLLKPGGMILFRDYGRYDMAQLRFKDRRCLSANFYSRGDGTLVYFFTQDELRELFTSAGLVEIQNVVDRRLQVNRARQVKMYRVWIQAKFRKPLA